MAERRSDDDSENVPPRLDYFSANGAEERRGAASALGWVLLIIGLAPAACGVLNAVGTARSGVPQIIQVHNKAAAVLGIGTMFCTLGGLGVFVAKRDGVGILTGIMVFMVEMGLFICTGVAANLRELL